MKLLCRVAFRLCVLCSLLTLLPLPLISQEKWTTVETFSYNWNGRGKATFVIQRTTTSTRILIRVPGERNFVLDVGELESVTGKDSWVDPKLQRASRARINSVYALMLPTGSDETTALFLTGYAYASSPGALWVIGLAENGLPYVVFHAKEMGLKDVVDLDGDGFMELVGNPCLSEGFGDYLWTYDPFRVYSISGHSAKYSLKLSKQYNLEHYVWAVPNCSEKYAVLEIPGRKLKVFALQEGERRDAEARRKLGPNPKRQF